MEKRKFKAFGKDTYLLGKGKDGEYYYLEEAEWDCEWYWGLGYIETYTNKKRPDLARDIDSRSHWDNLFSNHDRFFDFWEETTFNRDEGWQLLELMKSAYVARHYSDMLHCGGAHYTSNPCKELIENEKEYKRINEILIPNIMKKVYEILSPTE